MCKVYEKLIREYILDGIEAVLSDKQGGGPTPFYLILYTKKAKTGMR